MARIAIVDSDADVRAFIALAVTQLGHEAVTVPDEDPALGRIDVAIVEPATETGLAAAKRLRGVGIKLIFASIRDPEPAFLAMKPAAYLTKPFAPADLDEAIRGALG